MTDMLIILANISGLLTGAYIAWVHTRKHYERLLDTIIDLAYDAGYERAHLDNAVRTAEDIVREVR